MTKKDNHYVDKKELQNELQNYRDSGIVSEELGVMIQNIVKNYATKSSFRGYTYIEDMKSAAVLRIIAQLGKVNPDGNPFSYITRIAFNEFLAFLRTEERYSDVRIRYRDEIWSELTVEEGLNDQNNGSDSE